LPYGHSVQSEATAFEQLIDDKVKQLIFPVVLTKI
jgi:hypothetical protein